MLGRLLHMMGDVWGLLNGWGLLNNRMVRLAVVARGEQKTTFQALDRGLKLDRAMGSSTICLNDRIHDRMAPPGQTSRRHSDWYAGLEFRHRDHCQGDIWNSGKDSLARFLNPDLQLTFPVAQIIQFRTEK
jgi:hypothetical protein